MCPHAGGVGLCEYVQHLAVINYVLISPSWHNVMVEFADHLHEHFADPVRVEHGHYRMPKMAGYSATLKPQSVDEFKYPHGAQWHK